MLTRQLKTTRLLGRKIVLITLMKSNINRQVS